MPGGRSGCNGWATGCSAAHNTDIYENIDGVLDTLLAFIAERAP